VADDGLLPQLEASFEEGADGKEVSDFLEESESSRASLD